MKIWVGGSINIWKVRTDMSSVTVRIGEIKQPRGGYVKPSEFEIIKLDDGVILNLDENIHGTITGMAVDYLTRFAMGENAADAFAISVHGAAIAEKLGVGGSLEVAEELLKGIRGLDDESVINACKLVAFDAWRRNPAGARMGKGYNDINPDKDTIQNIHTFVNRSITFWEKYGPIVRDGFTFEPVDADKEEYKRMRETHTGSFGGYTATVDSGDGDYLTKDTLWDFKVTKSKPAAKHTLQLLMYWIMGQHSGQEIYKGITKLGIFNPRLNIVYLLDISKVSGNIIKEVEDDVICY